MTRITILGLGAMGSRIAANLVADGHAVTVWNRSPAAAATLTDKGASLAPSPRDAVRDAEVAIAMLRDDEASRAVWIDAGALAAMPHGAVLVESSTLSLDWTRTLADAAGSAGIAFLDAPVAGSRPQAEARQLIHFVGGDDAALERVRPVLAAIGAAVHHVGPAGSGTAMKLAVNALFGVQVAAVAELLATLERHGVVLDRAAEVLGATPVCSPAAKGAAASMAAGAFAPMFPVELVEKDFGYAEAAAGGVEAAPITAAARAVFRRALDRGMGDDNLTGVVRLYR